MFALEISNSSQIRNSLRMAGILLKEWIANDGQSSKSTVVPGMSAGHDAAALTARNILKALYELAHMSTSKAHDINSIITTDLRGLIPTIVNLVDRADLRIPETPRANADDLREAVGSMRLKLQSNIVEESTRNKTQLAPHVQQLLQAITGGLNDASLSFDVSLPQIPHFPE
jgi:hypothetical protein